MKIVHIHQYYNDHMAYHENILPDYQAKLGHEVVMLTSTLSNGFNKDERVKAAGAYRDKGFLVRRIEVKGEFKHRFVCFKNLSDYLEEEKPDYIYHHSVTAPSLKAACDYKKKHPEVFLAADNHADWNISAKHELWKLFYYNILWTLFLKEYDSWIDVYFGVTPIRCLFLEEELGVPREKIRLLPIGTDVDHVKVEEDRASFFKRYGLDESHFIITHGGKITPEKQIGRVVKAFMRIKAPEACLVLFGQIKDEEVATLMKQDSRIKYLGWLNREDTLAMLKYSQVGIWNTQHTTLLEDAITVGLPMILRYYGSTSHLMKDSGLFLYEGSVKEIQDKLSFMLEHKELLNEMREKTYCLRDLLSYHQIAAESIAYKTDLSNKPIHDLFMSEAYTDYDYQNLRLFSRT